MAKKETEPDVSLKDSIDEMNYHLSKQNELLKSLDWKMWVVMNTLVDHMINNGFMAADQDPRKS